VLIKREKIFVMFSVAVI